MFLLVRLHPQEELLLATPLMMRMNATDWWVMEALVQEGEEVVDLVVVYQGVIAQGLLVSEAIRIHDSSELI